jgi:hypothetical protein
MVGDGPSNQYPHPNVQWKKNSLTGSISSSDWIKTDPRQKIKERPNLMCILQQRNDPRPHVIEKPKQKSLTTYATATKQKNLVRRQDSNREICTQWRNHGMLNVALPRSPLLVWRSFQTWSLFNPAAICYIALLMGGEESASAD